MHTNDRETHTARVLLAISVLCAAIFVSDLLVGREVPLSGLYVVALLMSMWLPRHAVRKVALLCFVLSGFALVRSLVPLHFPIAAANIIAVFGLGVMLNLALARARVEDALRESRETQVTTLRSIAEGVITTDDEGRITFMNPQAESLTGWTAAEGAGKPLESIMRTRDEGPVGPRVPPIEELSREAGAIGSAAGERRATLMSRGGRKVPIEQSTAAIVDSQGHDNGSVVVFRDITEVRRKEAEIEERAFRDVLTQLPNRSALEERLDLEIAHARRNRDSLVLMFVDLDHFKEINDCHGHQAGDEVLRVVATRLSDTLRECDTVARLGGDEFTVLLPGVKEPADAELVADKIRERLAEPIPFEDVELRAGASIGIAHFPEDGEDAGLLLRRADQAMYRAKQSGRAPQPSPHTS